MKASIMDALYTAVGTVTDFKSKFKQYVPPYSSVTQFPAFAIVSTQETRRRALTTGSNFEMDSTVFIYIYNKYKTGSYDDILSDLVDKVAVAINNDAAFQATVLDGYVTSIKNDGSLLYPHAMAEIEVAIKYRDIC